MKKLFICILTFFLFTSYSFAVNEQRVLNILESKFKKLNFEQLDDVNYRLNDLIKKSDKESMLGLLTKIKENLKNIAEKKVVFVENHYFLDFSDDKNVLGFSDNVFVARIIKNNGLRQDTTYKNLIKETLFEVEVLYNIKGNLKGNIETVFQGGYNKRGKLVLSEGQTFLREGGIYLMVTLGEEHKISSYENAIHQLHYNYKNKNSLSKVGTKSLIENNKKVQDFIKAYPVSAYYKTKNAYKDLTEKQKENLKTFDNGFTKELQEIK